MENILDLLVCPVTKGRLVYDKEQQLLISYQAKLAFRLIDGVPNMLIEQALDLADLDQVPDAPPNANTRDKS